MSDVERTLLRRLSRLNRRHPLVRRGDRILVACSGGKDSWAMLHLLRQYQRVVPFCYELVAVTVDQGHPGFPADRVRRYLENEGFEYRVVVQDTYSVVTAQTPAGKTTCSLCSRMRRAILHRAADQIGANKIALGHHRDDLIETVLMSMMYAGEIRSMAPYLAAPSGGHAVIRPLATCSELALSTYALRLGAPIVPCGLCGAQTDAKRKQTKQLLAQLEEHNPNLRQNLLASLCHVRAHTLMDPHLTPQNFARDVKKTTSLNVLPT